ncbi:N-formylglutamate amidohydrolase [Novosphingobium colocasiae]|uniref:N-formylglutamate amidohydrolase n=1 Tax=Novosphingobium colocasiae TaxID=1256513 RepID=UPI0035B3B06D
MNSEIYRLLGSPEPGGLLIVSDHASNRIPAGIDLGIPAHLLDEHVAIDIGVAGVAERMVRPGTAAFLCQFSRLVCDVNRDEHAPTVCPIASDGHAIPGNALDHAGREARLDRFFRPYHAALADVLDTVRPGLVLSLHSFTPQLASRPDEARPWHIGILYNHDDAPARIAIPLLEAQGLCVGDQLPYSGVLLNATMNHHCEGRHPYLGVEVRQDLIADAAGQEEWAERLAALCRSILGAQG